jgi:Ca-activated chloride channel homolog
MGKNPAVAIRTVSSCVLLGLAVLCALARGQSADDVHIMPGRAANQDVSRSDGKPTNETPSLHPPNTSFHVNVDLVLVPVTVNDALERPVMNLSKQDFALFEDDKQKEIRYFSTESEPVSVAILLDVSKSMSDKVDTERAAVVEFFKNANPRDEYFAITFSDRPRLVADATQSLEEIETKLETVEPGGSTAMLDAVYLAEHELRFARYRRKAILIISDGGDNASRYNLREIKPLVRESDVQIYAIGLFETFFFNTLEERLGKKWLREITDPTGGRAITVDDRKLLPEAAAEISREMRNQYVLGYQLSSAAPTRWRKIRVQVTSGLGRHPLRASYKRGYLSEEP